MLGYLMMCVNCNVLKFCKKKSQYSGILVIQRGFIMKGDVQLLKNVKRSAFATSVYCGVLYYTHSKVFSCDQAAL